MSNERTEKTPVAIVSLSINRDLLGRVDDQAEFENRTRSNMIARMIEFYIERKHYACSTSMYRKCGDSDGKEEHSEA